MEGRNLVQSLESADRDARTLLATLSTCVNAVNLSHQPRNIHNSKKPECPCYRCGEPHFDRDSRFKDAECRNCRKKGHIARTCRSKPPIQNSQSRQPRWRQQTNLLTKDPPEDADSDPDIRRSSLLFVYYYKPISQTSTCECSTESYSPLHGGRVSVCNQQKHVQQILAECTSPSSRTFSCKTPDLALPVLGTVHVEVTSNNQTANLPLVVVKEHGPSFFGRDWLQHIKLDWKTLNNVCCVDPP